MSGKKEDPRLARLGPGDPIRGLSIAKIKYEAFWRARYNPSSRTSEERDQELREVFAEWVAAHEYAVERGVSIPAELVPPGPADDDE